jgi:uncharacterized protein YqhQ
MSQRPDRNEKFKTSIGGQAVIEGVMMRGPEKGAMACRLPNGEIDLETWEVKGSKAWYRKVPFVRGIFSFISSLILGYKCLMKSADKQMTEEDEEPETKFEKWLSEKLGDKIMPVISALAMVLGVGLAVVLFIWLPSLLSKFVDKHIISLTKFEKNVIEGLIKIIVFISYTALTRLMKDMSVTYEYHGAEHKTIACYERQEELNVENVKKQCRFHPRCGTSFIFLVLFISIFVTTIFNVSWKNLALRVLFKIALLPVVTGIAFELIRLAGKYDNPVTRAISAPGLWIQRITTKEPNDKQIECAIAALKECIPANEGDDKW